CRLLKGDFDFCCCSTDFRIFGELNILQGLVYSSFQLAFGEYGVKYA
ncbi:hypothetical protein H5410_049896, partial [Solanum commersonii]